MRLGIGCGREWNGAGQPFEIKVMGIMHKGGGGILFLFPLAGRILSGL